MPRQVVMREYRLNVNSCPLLVFTEKKKVRHMPRCAHRVLPMNGFSSNQFLALCGFQSWSESSCGVPSIFFCVDAERNRERN